MVTVTMTGSVSRLVTVLVLNALLWRPSAENELYNGIIKDNVCAEDAFVPHCDAGKLVYIKSALYGRMDKVCGLYYTKECKHDVFPSLDDNCQNGTHCSVKSGSDVFGNPCRFYENSYLEVQYWCIQQDIIPRIETRQVCAGNDFTADCGEGHVMQILSARYGDISQQTVTACGVDIFNHINTNCSAHRTCHKSVAREQFPRPCTGGSTCALVRYMCLPQSQYTEMTTPSYLSELAADFVTWQPVAPLRPTTVSPVSVSTARGHEKQGFNELEIVVYTVVGIITGMIIIIIAVTCYNLYSQRKPGLKESVYIYSEVTRRPIEMTDMSRVATANVTNVEHANPSAEANPVRHRSYEQIAQSDETEQNTIIAPSGGDPCITLPEGSVV